MIIYFDNNATTKVDQQVFEEIKPYFCDLYGNPSSMHTFGGDVGHKITQARQRTAELLNCKPEEIIFTGCGTEADNNAIRGSVEAQPNRDKIVTSRVEHPAVLQICRHLASRGYRLAEIDVDRQGNLDLEQLEKEVDEHTSLVTIMFANNETGVLLPIEKIAEIAHKNGAVFHTDAVQAVGKIPIDLQKTEIDLLSLSGHKLHAPKGIGALYIRRGTRMAPFILGGHQEGNRRAGTENVPGIIGLGKACEIAGQHFEDENTRVKSFRDKLENGILSSCPDCWINGNCVNRLPNTTNISFEYVEGEAILLMLDRHGICASSGSACASGSLEPSHVLRAMGVPFTAAHGSIRLSLSRFNTESEVDFVIDKLPPIIEKLRKMSPFVKEVPKPGKSRKK